MKLFSGREVSEAYRYFYGMIDNNIDLFGESLAEEIENSETDELTDDEFVNAYVRGVNVIIEKMNQEILSKLEEDKAASEKYLSVCQHPEKGGFRFPNQEMTIGKLYLFYVYSKTKKKAPKNDCIKLEKHLVQRIGQQCLKYGIVR